MYVQVYSTPILNCVYWLLEAGKNLPVYFLKTCTGKKYLLKFIIPSLLVNNNNKAWMRISYQAYDRRWRLSSSWVILLKTTIFSLEVLKEGRPSQRQGSQGVSAEGHHIRRSPGISRTHHGALPVLCPEADLRPDGGRDRSLTPYNRQVVQYVPRGLPWKDQGGYGATEPEAWRRGGNCGSWWNKGK